MGGIFKKITLNFAKIFVKLSPKFVYTNFLKHSNEGLSK